MIYAGEFPAIAGSITIDQMTSKPRLILFTGTNQDTFDTILTTGVHGPLGGFFGFACENPLGSIVQYVEAAILAGGQCSNLSEHAIYAQSAPGTHGTNTLIKGDVVALNDDGFKVNITDGTGDHRIFFMAFTDIDFIYPLLHATEVDGDPQDEILGFDPSFIVSLGQWRNSGHTFPKSTSAQAWMNVGFADVAGAAEWMFQGYSKAVRLGQRWDNVINSPGSDAHLAAMYSPWVFGSIIGLGYLLATVPTPGTLRLNQDPGVGASGFDFALAIAQEECLRMDVDDIQAQFAEQTFNLNHVGGPPEGVLFINMESAPTIQSNQPGRMGFGFAVPTYGCSWLLDSSIGAMYQTADHSWISSLTATDVSYGDTDFDPPTNDIGFITQSLDAGGGRTAFGALKTFCREPLLVSTSGLNLYRKVGMPITIRGGGPQ